MGAAYHIGSFHSSHPAAPGSNLDSADFSLLLSLWTEERSNPSSADALDFADAVNGEFLR